MNVASPNGTGKKNARFYPVTDTCTVNETKLQVIFFFFAKKKIQLERVQQRIECYDISHEEGNGDVGSLVVFIDGRPARHLYRKFIIKTDS